MTAKSEIVKDETTKSSSNKNWIIWVIGFLIPLALVAFVDIPPEYLNPMNFFLGAVVSLSITALAAFLTSYQRVKKSADDFVWSLVSLFNGVFIFFLIHWPVLLLSSTYLWASPIPGFVLFYEFIFAIAMLICTLITISSMKVFGTEIRNSFSLFFGTCMVVALIILILPNALTNDARFPLLFLFTTIPFLLFGGLGIRSNESGFGVILASPFILAAVDYLLVNLDIFDFTTDLRMQVIVLLIFAGLCKFMKDITNTPTTETNKPSKT
ncbi:hypothetical protein KBC70_04580 [Candidatus Woesebacteria bacterium]|nr:hypothetical protein [Candidatus Woesebacteria bacterium]